MITIKIKKNKKPASIRLKIFLYLTGFCAILLMLMWLFQVVFLDNFYKLIKTGEIRTSVAAVTHRINSAQLQDILANIAQSKELCAEILDKDGNVLYSEEVLRDCHIHKMSLEERQRLIRKTSDSGGELLLHFNRQPFRPFRNVNFDDWAINVPPPDTSESIILSRTVTAASGQTYYIVMNSVISPVSATVNTLRIQIYCISAIMMILALLIALLLSRHVSKPIEKINGGAKQLAKGDYSVNFAGGGFREVSELADTLNYAAGELSKVENLRRELIANVSHDLRTPLTLITGYSEAIRDLPNENNAENLDVIIDESKRLTTLVNDMMDISKLEAGAAELNLSVFNLTESVKKEVGKLEKFCRPKGYVLNFEADRDVFVSADKIKITQVVYNLLTNAVNYTGKDKTVTVRQSVEGGKVKIEVTDTGEGIDEKQLPFIWERYYRSPKSHKRAVTGTGLGLSIVKRILLLHGADYGVRSSDKGSCFWFVLDEWTDKDNR